MTVTYGPTYKDIPINADKKNGQGCRTDILDETHALMSHSLARHGKVFCSTFGLNYPEGYPVPEDNRHISTFMSTFNKNLKRNKLDPISGWVREQKGKDRHHYHVIVFCDGNKIQFPHRINELAKEHWGRTIGSDNNGIVIHTNKKNKDLKCSHRLRKSSPDFQKAVDDCFYHLSYFAKTNSKGEAPHRIREYGFSRIPKQ